jgi:hypothetical protein
MAKRCCADCVYAVRPTSRWLRVILSYWPGLLLCCNCAACPGKLREAYAHKVCRNFRPRRWPSGRRGQAPPPTEDGACYIPLTRGAVAIVDREDYEELSRYKWFLRTIRGHSYAARRSKGKTILMHRVLMQPPAGMVVDHIDGNGLNNRRSNLRVCTQGQNGCNSRPRRNRTGFRGVQERGPGKYGAGVKYKGKRYWAGVYDDPIEAAKARDNLARQLHGPYAWLNLPEAHDPKRPGG